MVIPVDDAADPRIADYVRLRDSELRKSLEAERGLFIAEGEKVIRRAVATGHRLRSVLTTAKWLDRLADVIGDVPTYLVSDEVMRGIAGFQVHRGALAAVERPELPSVAGLLTGPGSGEGPPGRILILEDLVDHGNVGAIFRCAAALGVDAIILSPRCADPLYRRAVKVSMGAVFAIPYARMDDWYHGLGEVRAAGFRLLALTPDQSAVPLHEAELGERVALLLGSEGDGLSARWLDLADERVCIPMSPAAMARGVDSLNVVAAAAIACHGLMRGR
ncbi:TrmH family RNA methyltransferase [Thermobispora bispora]|uniref:tRNA/rRNA methyltransferase (SpoU) n=1 Tax=Thermobispora bispora (strain ATCC 19993 / DSM 43833 / CBS 139.67 / JCM 10125 / KCTC 9307 / NBRC 14880 / R51) TaxID=469371 RepID=D6Y5H7_THEBD|nr:RNA methyltransferase [Thermobispora bispora]ADG89372.1 tRNA/rRNA methyltransferase (SpoU) [Thermobispora bispora DSM 43833]MBO2473553.1 RNA methyltransferase [Actinomycetales bacterium]MDI9579375.1 RNA methyltransferase [Thermobispora sp.]QSI49028.1 RNA methyltransferase [Thermobispora bispora]